MQVRLNRNGIFDVKHASIVEGTDELNSKRYLNEKFSIQTFFSPHRRFDGYEGQNR